MAYGGAGNFEEMEDLLAQELVSSVLCVSSYVHWRSLGQFFGGGGRRANETRNSPEVFAPDIEKGIRKDIDDTTSLLLQEVSTI